ncbi:MAG TPA: LysR family transcriptional regulator [Bacteroidia bacterium]
MAKNQYYDIHFRIWLYEGDEKVLGKGRVELLELIKKTGSITNAAKEMKMSYRQAWQMVKEMNETAKSPLVEKKMGGKEGGGAFITSTAERYISEFHELNHKLKIFIEKEAAALKK